MSAEEFYQNVLEGVIAKLLDPNATHGIRGDAIENLRLVF